MLLSFKKAVPKPTSAERLRHIFSICAKADEGRALVDLIHHATDKIEFMQEPNTMGLLEVKYRFIFDLLDAYVDKFNLNQNCSDGTLAGVVLHEAGHLQQFNAKVILPKFRVSSLDYAWYSRVLEADTQSQATIISLKIGLAGDMGAWSGFKKYGYERMAHAAAKQYNKDPASIDTPEFRRIVFDAWFEKRSFMGIQKPNIRTLMDRKNETKWEEIDNIMPYVDPAILQKRDVECIGLSSAPQKENYLTLPGFRPLDDPYYKDVICPKTKARLTKTTEMWKQRLNMR